MSFRDNLQHLRATRNMTQEQLAMLLGVSRQSVTKWEAEKSQPEMDKLLKICQIFECSLDDLVTGDLTGRASEPAATVPAGPPTDVCGYDEHWQRFARQVSLGITVMLAFIGVGFLFEGRLSLAGTDADLIMIAIIFAGVVAGLAFLIPAGMAHVAFQKAHPYVEDFYTEEDRATAHRDMARATVVGIGLILAGCLCIMFFGEQPETEQIGLCLLLLFIAAGVYPLVRFGMLLGRVNVAEYNRSVVEDLEVEDIVSAQLDEARREALLASKRQDEKLGAVCGTIMIVATIVGLALLFAPVFSAPDPSDFDPISTSAAWFWVAWPVGGMLCGIVTLIWKAFRREG